MHIYLLLLIIIVASFLLITGLVLLFGRNDHKLNETRAELEKSTKETNNY